MCISGGVWTAGAGAPRPAALALLSSAYAGGAATFPLAPIVRAIAAQLRRTPSESASSGGPKNFPERRSRAIPASAGCGTLATALESRGVLYAEIRREAAAPVLRPPCARGGLRGLVRQVAGGAPRLPEAATSASAASAPPSASAPPPVFVIAPTPLDLAARQPAKAVDLAPAKDGRLGAWLLIGPYRPRGGKNAGAAALRSAPEGLDEKQMQPRAGAEWAAVPAFTRIPPSWQVVHSNDGPIDVAGALHTKDNDLVAYAAGTLHLEKAGTYHLLLGADDGVSVTIDGKHVFLRDEARPQRDGDDLITVDLAAGDDPIVLKLHQRDAAWAFSVRVLDASYAPPEGAYLSLPGTTEADAKDLAWKMSWVSVDRGMVGTGYAPKLTVRFPEGMPRGVPVKVHARLAPSHRPVERRHGEDAPPQSSKAGAFAAPAPPQRGAALPPPPLLLPPAIRCSTWTPARFPSTRRARASSWSRSRSSTERRWPRSKTRTGRSR